MDIVCKATVLWKRSASERFIDNKYDRSHKWNFDGGIVVPASSSPHVVPVPLSNENAVDPEEALVASASSCHMLWFLSIAAKKQWLVESYADNAIGIMGKNEHGKIAMTKIILNPKVIFGENKKPTLGELQQLHHMAHENCTIAHSLKTTIEIILED